MKKKPNLQAVRKQFLKAKTVNCITNKINVDVTGITEFEYDKEAKIWTSIGGAITFWKEGVFADIVSSITKAPCSCESCDCNKGETLKCKQ